MLTLLIELPSVQNFLVDKAAKIVSEKIGTTVAIEKLRFRFVDGLVLNGFYAEDFQHDTLLYVDRLSVKFGSFNQTDGLQLRSGKVQGGHLFLHETPEGDMNIKHVVDRLTKKDRTPKENPFRLTIDKIRLEDFDLIIERREHRDPEYGIDFYDMHINRLTGDVENFSLAGSNVSGNVSGFSFEEHTGFAVENFATAFVVGKGTLEFENLVVETAKSRINLPQVALRGEDWGAYKDFIRNVKISGQIVSSGISTDDIAHFAPKLLQWELAAHDVSAEVSGRVADLRVNVRNMEFGQSSSLKGNVRLRGLPDVKRGRMTLDLQRLKTNAADIAPVLAAIAHLNISGKSFSAMEAAGEIVLAGKLDGSMQNFDGDATLTTMAGVASLNASRHPREGSDKENPVAALRAHADLRHIRLGDLLHSKLFGNLTATADFNGAVAAGRIWGDVAATVSDIIFKDCRYDDITVRGDVNNKSFSGRVKHQGKDLDIDLAGIADFNGRKPMYDFSLDVDRADLHAMNINQRDSVSLLSLKSNLYLVGKSIDEMNGRITIDNGTYIYNADTLRSSIVELEAQSNEKRRSLNLTSDFADMSFTGPSSYAELVKYLQEAMRKYLPGLADADSRYSGDDKGYSALSVRVKDIDPLLDAIASGLQLARGSRLDFTMNPATNHLMLRAESDYIERNKLLVTELNMNLSNQGDSLSVYLASEELFAGALHLPQLSLMGGAKNDRVLLSGVMHSDSLSGVVGLIASIDQDSVTARRRLAVDILPSKLTAGDKSWQMANSRIVIDTASVAVNGFCISSGDEHLHLEGVASRSQSDSLMLEMKDFSLYPLTHFVKRMGYEIDGRGNGGAVMKAVLDGGVLTADISIDDMKVNQAAVAPLKLSSRWDVRQQRARIYMINRTSGDSIVKGYYAPATNRYYAEAVLDSLPLSMLDPMLVNVVSSTEGMATARVNILGQGRNASLNGQIDVKDLSTMVDYTHVRYFVPAARVDVKDNHFLAEEVEVFDAEGNKGLFTMDLSLEHLKNISYDFRIIPNQMLVLNTTLQENDYFYGKVYASGVANISGSKKGTTLDLVGTTEGDSKFYMPLSSKSDVSNADFVVFEQPGMKVDTSNYLLRKKMMFERRNRRTTASESNMSINIELTARPNTEVQLVIDPTVGDIIKARGEGTLNMRIVPKANILDMYGDYTISEGSYLFTLQNIINKLFIIESGSTIQWTGDPIDARLNIDAVYKLKASLQPLLASTTLDNITRNVPVECIINLTERLSNPTVMFDIKVPNADSEIQNAVANLLNNQQSIATQFMYLLVSGSFYSDASTTSSMGASASATTGFELLSNQLSNWLSSDDYNIILRYRPRSELTSDEIDIGFSKTLVDNRLLLEVEGNYLVDNKMSANSSMSNFMGEAYITWLIDRNGNLKLKGFTQTIDRFDENQGLQETGIGIYYKEDFENWADLKRRIRERFTSKRRRARLEAERAAKLEAESAADSIDVTVVSEDREDADSLKDNDAPVRRKTKRKE
ncbi:MAG: translocation/assembly module TamB domain-containing protein [Alistipes sp.]|nr:translocation/assembly module TamB domain-containing protein [Alistipes sp.]